MVKTDPVPRTPSRTLNFTGVSLLKFNSEINASLEINYTGKILQDEGLVKSFPLYHYSNATSANQLSFIYPSSSSLKIRLSALAREVIHFHLLHGSAATKPDRKTSPGDGERLLPANACEKPDGRSKEAALAEKRGERGATHLWKWCQRCPSAGCSCVSACEEGCMYHSSVHSPMDWWAACKSRRRSGWVPGAMRAKDKRALGIGQGKHGVTLFWRDVPALRSSAHKQKQASVSNSGN